MVDRGAGVISVIMPAYNEERALPNTLCALFTQQGDYEVVVVDGGSTDQTRAIVESFGFIDSASAPLSFVRYITRYVSRFTFHISRSKGPRIPDECRSKGSAR